MESCSSMSAPPTTPSSHGEVGVSKNRATVMSHCQLQGRNCVLPISHAGFTCERDPRIDSSDGAASEPGHFFGAANEHTERGHCDIGADITYNGRRGACGGMSERCRGRRSGRSRCGPPCCNRSRGRLHRGASLCKGKGERAGGSRKPTLCGRSVLITGSTLRVSNASSIASFPVQ